MKKLTALLLATSLSMSLFGCKDKNKNDGTQQTNEDDGLVSVWLVTSETEYDVDGSNGRRQITYTYNEKGMPLTMAYDIGQKKEWYDAEQDVNWTSFLPFDGNVDELYRYHYNDHGDLLYCEETKRELDQQGNETVYTDYYDYAKDQLVYHYDDQGRIESVDIYPTSPEGTVEDEVFSIACSKSIMRIYRKTAESNGGMISATMKTEG